MRPIHWDEGLCWDDPNLRRGDPSYLLELGDPGYVPPFSSPKKTKHHMKRQSYLPKDEPGILVVLIALDTNLPGALATKYDVDDSQLLRLRHGRYSYGWFVAAKPIVQQGSEALTNAHLSMTTGEPAPLQPLPGQPTLPPLPKFMVGAAEVTAQMEPGFFDFLSRLVQQIKNHDDYEETDGLTLKILGAVMDPPDPQIVPEVQWTFAASGALVLIVKKTPFQGYAVWVQLPNGAMAEVGFSTTRNYEVPLALPPTGTTQTWRVQVQYRYKNQPFGQKSNVVEIPVRGV
jgi:hypothetical protein